MNKLTLTGVVGAELPNTLTDLYLRQNSLHMDPHIHDVNEHGLVENWKLPPSLKTLDCSKHHRLPASVCAAIPLPPCLSELHMSYDFESNMNCQEFIATLRLPPSLLVEKCPG